MSASIQQKIARCIQALNVESIERLYSNMRVIEGYIQRKPIFLEWLHGQLTINKLGIPLGFSNRFHSSHVDTVKVWFLTMHASCGDMCLQGVDHLNLASLNNVNFPSRFQDCFSLSRLWLPNGFSGCLPDAEVCWLYSSNLDLVDEKQFQRCEWTLVLEGPPPISMRTKDVNQIRGVDATRISPSVWMQWCKVLKQAPIRYCAFPKELMRWDGVPDWSTTLKVLKIPPNPTLFAELKWFERCLNVEVLCLRNEDHSLMGWSGRGVDGLTVIPEGLMRLHNLRWLDVSMNPIQQMPEQFHTLQALQTLNLAFTELEDFPSVLLHLKTLQQLFIRNTNAMSTRRWLNVLSSQHTTVFIQRVVSHERLSLWDLSLMAAV